MDALLRVNEGHANAYGDDPVTAQFEEVMRKQFGEQARAFPVFNGTGANVVALQAALPRWGAVVCAASAHIHVDEAAAPETVGGIKLLPVSTPDGKLTPELIDEEAWGWGDQHRAQPLAVSISQTTELGTCYSAAEVRAIAEHAHERGMVVHMDGSRLTNAAAHAGAPLRELTTDAGVDILSLGGTKNGALGAEAVVVLNPEVITGVSFLRKASTQLASKMRFVSAQLLALYEGDLWFRSASHSNAMAQRLWEGIHELSLRDPRVQLLAKAESNAVFATLPSVAIEHARAVFPFYDWPGGEGQVRLMCSFDTSEEEVEELLRLIAEGLTLTE